MSSLVMPNHAIVPFDPGPHIRVSPLTWPEKELEVHPGNLELIAPHGNGIYGYQDPSQGMFNSAPSQEAAGGTLYFGNDVEWADFIGLLRVLGVISRYGRSAKAYVVYVQESKTPGVDGYLTQMRIVSRFGLRFMFRAINDREYDAFEDQFLPVEEALWTFILKEKGRWGTSLDGRNGLRGVFGGDGNFACEELAFGFSLENEYHRVYRIWSRAWLVTK